MRGTPYRRDHAAHRSVSRAAAVGDIVGDYRRNNLHDWCASPDCGRRRWRWAWLLNHVVAQGSKAECKIGLVNLFGVPVKVKMRDWRSLSPSLGPKV
jgi:hypothetical protein